MKMLWFRLRYYWFWRWRLQWSGEWWTLHRKTEWYRDMAPLQRVLYEVHEAPHPSKVWMWIYRFRGIEKF